MDKNPERIKMFHSSSSNGEYCYTLYIKHNRLAFSLVLRKLVKMPKNFPCQSIWVQCPAPKLTPASYKCSLGVSGVVQIAGFLTPLWETWIEFLIPSSSPSWRLELSFGELIHRWALSKPVPLPLR